MKYEQIAAWTRADVTRISSALKLGRRIAQENWIE
jgi:predicted flap endonuclease-1-like 5' DNA nuclease